MNTICGHDRSALVAALKWSAQEYVKPHMFAELAAFADEPIASCFVAICDPAKLAAMVAEEGRRLGLWSRVDTWHEGAYSPTLGKVVRTKSHWVVVFDNPATCISDHNDRECIPDICEHYGVDINSTTMSKARAIFLQWLQLPDGTRDEAEQVLRGSNGV